jgi:hypothetical protein
VQPLTEGEGHKLSERSEFLCPPKATAEGGEPKAKFLGGLSFVTFLCPQKKSKNSYGKAF